MFVLSGTLLEFEALLLAETKGLMDEVAMSLTIEVSIFSSLFRLINLETGCLSLKATHTEL